MSPELECVHPSIIDEDQDDGMVTKGHKIMVIIIINYKIVIIIIALSQIFTNFDPNYDDFIDFSATVGVRLCGAGPPWLMFSYLR